MWKEYEKGNVDGHIGCQLIFSDIGTPGPDKDFTIYDYLKETLIQYGIPAEEIAFIHDATLLSFPSGLLGASLSISLASVPSNLASWVIFRKLSTLGSTPPPLIRSALTTKSSVR